MTRPPGIPPAYKGKPFIHAWTCKNATGAIEWIEARYDDGTKKENPPFIPKGGAGFKNEAPPEPRALYGVDTLTTLDAPLFIHEGPKKAAAMHSLGLPAVASLGGSKSAHKSDWKPLQPFKRIYVLPNHDEPGETYARDVVRILVGLPGTREIKIARLPDLPQSGDVVDWLQARVADWDGFGPIPREPGDELQTEFLEAVEDCAEAPLREWLTPEAVSVAPEPWTPPIPLDAGDIPEWPRTVFPPVMQEFSEALASSLELPREAGAMLTLAAVAAAAQRTYEVKIKSDYRQPLGLWTAVVLPPASRKTAAQGAATRPLMLWQTEQRAALEPVIERTQSERKTLVGRAENLRAKAAKANSEALAGIMQDIEAAEHDVPAVPTLPRVVTDDVTVEHLAALMQENGESIAVMSDESGVFGILGGRYSKNGGPNLDLWLKSHEGAPVVVDRVSRASVYLAYPSLTVALCLQPDVLASLRNTHEFRGRGLLGRFLWAVPACNVGMRSLSGPSMPRAVEDAYCSTIRAILSHERTPEAQRRTLTLSDDGRNLWHAFGLRLESAMRDGGELEHVWDWAGKLAAAVARVASVMHVCRHADGEPWARPVSTEDVRNAIRIGEVLVRHALLAFDAMQADPALENARMILSWIHHDAISTFTRRDVQSKFKARFPRADAIDPALDVLHERGFIRPQTRCAPLGRGRPSRAYDVNPQTFIR